MEIRYNKDLNNFKIPNTIVEYRRLLNSVFTAIRKEPTLCVHNHLLYDYLMKLQKVYFSAFFVKYSIEDKPDYYSTVIASDKDGDLLIFSKDDDGQYLEVRMDINSREKYIRFGLTYPSDNSRYIFYKTNDCYIDYHRSYDDDSCARQMRTRTVGGWDTVWCDENGQSNILTNMKGMWSDFKKIFK